MEEDNKKSENKEVEPTEKVVETESVENISEIIPEEILEGVPEEDRSRIKSIISQTMISGVMRRNNPISHKVTSAHITKLIDNSDAQDIRDREERKSDKNYQLILLVIGLAFLAFLIVFLKDDKELLYKIIIAIISFVGGFGIGKSAKNKKEEE